MKNNITYQFGEINNHPAALAIINNKVNHGVVLTESRAKEYGMEKEWSNWYNKPF